MYFHVIKNDEDEDETDRMFGSKRGCRKYIRTFCGSFGTFSNLCLKLDHLDTFEQN